MALLIKVLHPLVFVKQIFPGLSRFCVTPFLPVSLAACIPLLLLPHSTSNGQGFSSLRLQAFHAGNFFILPPLVRLVLSHLSHLEILALFIIEISDFNSFKPILKNLIYLIILLILVFFYKTINLLKVGILSFITILSPGLNIVDDK